MPVAVAQRKTRFRSSRGRRFAQEWILVHYFEGARTIVSAEVYLHMERDDWTVQTRPLELNTIESVNLRIRFARSLKDE